MRKPTLSATPIITVVLLVLALFTLSSCEEKLSGIGYDLLRDTVAVQSVTLGDSGVFTSSAYEKKVVNALGISYTLNYASPYLFIGKVPSENLESWVVIKAPLLPDTVGYVDAIELKLPLGNEFLYGDAATDSISFQVFLETQGKVTDSTKALSMADLSPTSVGFGSAKIAKDSLGTIRIVLDSSRVNPFVHTASLAFVLVPTDGMKNIRALSSVEDADLLVHPQIHYTTIKNGDTTQKYYDAKFDYHLVTDNASTTPGTFRLRGSSAKRNTFTINIKAIKEKLALDPYATFNNGLLQLHLEPASFSSSVVPVDTTAPILLELTSTQTIDSAVFPRSYGFKDGATSDIYDFQIREVIERALRIGLDSVVLELRSGYVGRTFTGVGAYVEDYHLNRWSFYDVTAIDPKKRPTLVLTYSYLNK